MNNNFTQYPPASYVPAEVGDTIHIDNENKIGLVVGVVGRVYVLRLANKELRNLPFEKRHTIMR